MRVDDVSVTIPVDTASAPHEESDHAVIGTERTCVEEEGVCVEAEGEGREEDGDGGEGEGVKEVSIQQIEEESQEVRDQRVQESLEIWRRQQAEIRDREMARTASEMSGGGGNQMMSDQTERNDQPNGSTISSTLSSRYRTSSTWDSTHEVVPASPRAVYWTEWMDLKLAELVRTCVFDFPAIAKAFQEVVSTEEEFRKVPGYGLQRHAELQAVLSGLTAEACRLRWADLDARRWGDSEPDGVSPGEEGRDCPPVYRVCVKPDELGKGHGAQPSYQAMASIASGSFPSYLKVPAAFPSTAEFEDGDDTDNDDASLEKLD